MKTRLNELLESDIYYGFAYGLSVGCVLFSGAGLVVCLGIVLFLITLSQHKARNHRDRAKKDVA